MDNPELSAADFDYGREQATKLLFSLYGIEDAGPPYVLWAECMECDALSPALWMVGDFLLCHRCTARRFRVRAHLTDSGYFTR